MLTSDLWERQNFADVVQQPDEVEPIVVWPLFTDALRGLEVVDAVREIVVGIGVVHEIIQQHDHLHDRELPLVKLQPLLPLLLAKLNRLLRVHGVVSLLHHILPLRVLVVAEAIPKGILLGLPIMKLLQGQSLRLLLHHLGSSFQAAARRGLPLCCGLISLAPRALGGPTKSRVRGVIRLGFQLLQQCVQVLRQHHLPAQPPGELRRGRRAHDARVPQHLLLLRLVRLALRACLDQVQELRELDPVRLPVAFGEAPLRWRHQVPVGVCELDGACHLVLRREHTPRTKGLHALVVAIGCIAARVSHREESTGILGDNRHGVEVAHLLDLCIVAVANRQNGLWCLTSGEPILHVKVVDQHVLEDAAACSEILQRWQRVVAAAGLHHLQLPDGPLVQLALQCNEVPVTTALVTTHKRQVVLQGQVHGLLHFAHRVRDWLLRKDGLLRSQRLDNEGEVRVCRGGNDDDVHGRVREGILQRSGPLAAHVCSDSRGAGLIDIDHPSEARDLGEVLDGGQMEVARTAQADEGNAKPLRKRLLRARHGVDVFGL
mmetsp:Transcript_80898/g.204489  ORF Transcript_80898/g.204489 Transcript_80898/m.204489 type:complete len:546 (+) Transcript_80898:859-2496(+)